MKRKIKLSRECFESGIRTKSFEPQDFANIEVIENEDCTKCELCSYLTADPKIFNGRKLCELCYYKERTNSEHCLKEK